MATFYKGVPPHSHYGRPGNSPTLNGFKALGARRVVSGPEALVNHIANYRCELSPYLSLTASFVVARRYAMPQPGSGERGKVWQIEVAGAQRAALKDPLQEILKSWPGMSLEVARSLAARSWRVGAGRSALVLEALVSSLRDAEVLAEGEIPASWIRPEPIEVG